jgi:hypothetical protein
VKSHDRKRAAPDPWAGGHPVEAGGHALQVRAVSRRAEHQMSGKREAVTPSEVLHSNDPLLPLGLRFRIQRLCWRCDGPLRAQQLIASVVAFDLRGGLERDPASSFLVSRRRVLRHELREAASYDEYAQRVSHARPNGTIRSISIITRTTTTRPPCSSRTSTVTSRSRDPPCRWSSAFSTLPRHDVSGDRAAYQPVSRSARALFFAAERSLLPRPVIFGVR